MSEAIWISSIAQARLINCWLIASLLRRTVALAERMSIAGLSLLPGDSKRKRLSLRIDSFFVSLRDTSRTLST
jgi:hypothetical protein